MRLIHELISLPEVRALWTGSPLDLVGIGFALLILYVLVGGTLSMIYHQVKYIAHALTHRSYAHTGALHPYTKALIYGTSPELRSLRATQDRARQRAILSGIIHTLEVQDSSPIARALVRALRARL